MELVDQLRLTIPEEIRSAEDVLSQKDQILNIAQTDARRTKSMADDELREKLNQSEIVTQAETRAAATRVAGAMRANPIVPRMTATRRASYVCGVYGRLVVSTLAPEPTPR